MFNVDLRVKVDRDWLTQVIKKNRDEHLGVYTEAFKKYQDAYLGFLREQFDLLQDNVKARKDYTVRYFSGAKPEDHTIDYDLVLSMLRNATEKEITISGSDYRRFVQDRWEWTAQFVNTSNSYGVSTKFDGKGFDPDDN